MYRFGTRRVNWYVVDDDEGLLVVDAGLPGHWEELLDGLDDLGCTLSDLAAEPLLAHLERVTVATLSPLDVSPIDDLGIGWHR